MLDFASFGVGLQSPGIVLVSDGFETDLEFAGSLKLPGPDDAKVGLALAILQGQAVAHVEQAAHRSQASAGLGDIESMGYGGVRRAGVVVAPNLDWQHCLYPIFTSFIHVTY